MAWRKPLLYTGIAAALLVVGCVLALHLLIDADKLKATAEGTVEGATGRKFRIGELTLRFFPMPALRASRVAMENTLEVRQLDADLALVPLMVGKVHVKSLSLEGVRAILEEAEDGSVDWPAMPKAEEKKPAAGEGAGVEIGAVHLRDVVIQRRRKGVEAEPWKLEEVDADVEPGLRNVTFTAKVSRHGQPLALAGRFADLSQLGKAGAVSDGKLTLAWAATKATVAGRFPLHRSLDGHDLALEASSPSLDDALAFFGFERGKTAPLSLKAASRAEDGAAHVRDLALTLGDLRVRGDLRVSGGKHHVVNGRLEADRLDWLKTLQESGGKVKPKRHDEQVFHDDPLAWHALEVVGRIDGKLDLRVASLRLGNGLELRDVATRATLGDGRIALEPFSTAMLGGTAKGELHIDANRKAFRVDLDGDKLLLEQWFQQRGSKIAFTGGPMQVKARIALAGATFRELASSVSGPVTVRMGPGVWASPKAGEVEEMMVAAFTAKGAADMRFECVSARLDFKRGRAEGARVFGARSDVSQLLTGGVVDMREESLDLRGRVQAKKGVTVGLAAVAGGVQIRGRLGKPRIGMDPQERPALLARAAAAVATAGATLVGEALLTAVSREDACEAVFK